MLTPFFKGRLGRKRWPTPAVEPCAPRIHVLPGFMFLRSEVPIWDISGWIRSLAAGRVADGGDEQADCDDQAEDGGNQLGGERH